MKEISEEKINRIEDFVFHMGENEVKEWYADFNKKQPNINAYFNYGYKALPNPEAKEICKRSFIFIIKCFESYNYKIPFVTENELKRWGKEWQRVTDRITNQDNYALKLFQVGEDINQLPLTKHFVHKFILDPEISRLFSKELLGALVSVFMLYVWGINGLLQKIPEVMKEKSVRDDFPLISKETIKKAVKNYNEIKKEDLPTYLAELTKLRSDLTDYNPELKTPDLSNPFNEKYFFLYTIMYNSFEMQYGPLPQMLSPIVNEITKETLHVASLDLRNNSMGKIAIQMGKNLKQIHLADFVSNQIKEQESTYFTGEELEKAQVGMYGMMEIMDYTARKKLNSFACIENPYQTLIIKETIEKVDGALMFLNEKEHIEYFNNVYKRQKNIFAFAGDWSKLNASEKVLGIVMANLTSFFIQCYEYQLGARSEISFDTIIYYNGEWGKLLVDYTGIGDNDALGDLMRNKIKQPELMDYLDEIFDGTKERAAITDDFIFLRCKFFTMMILDIINNQPGIISKENIN